MRTGFRIKVLPWVRIGTYGVRVGPRVAGVRLGRRSAITGGVGPVYYTTAGRRRTRGRAKVQAHRGHGCLWVLGVLVLLALAAATSGVILIPATIIMVIGVVLRVRRKHQLV